MCWHRDNLDKTAQNYYDEVALPVACARAARAVDARVDAFLCFDDGLRDAAAREGFQLS